MKAAKQYFWVVLLLVAAWGGWRYLHPPPEKAIRTQLEKLAAAISQNPGGNIARVANVDRIGSFFHPNVSVNLEGFGRDVSNLEGRGEIERVAMAARQNGIPVAVVFTGFHIQAQPGETNASAVVTAEVRIGHSKEPIVQDLRLGFQMVDGSWLIRNIDPMKHLQLH